MVAKRNSVLLVDHDRAVREALQFSLRLDGMRVHAFGGGAGLLADPDLPRACGIVLDDRNPAMDGFALLHQLSARAVTVPSIMLSSEATARFRARAAVAGAHLVLEKPLLGNALRDAIRAIAAVVT